MFYFLNNNNNKNTYWAILKLYVLPHSLWREFLTYTDKTVQLLFNDLTLSILSHSDIKLCYSQKPY